MEKDTEIREIGRPAAETPNVAYLLRCGDGSIYAGWTNDLQKRLQAHQSGRGGRYTRTHLPVELVYFEQFATRHEAMRREWEFKHMTRAQKLALIAKVQG